MIFISHITVGRHACCLVEHAILTEEGMCQKQLEIYLKTGCKNKKKVIMSFDMPEVLPELIALLIHLD